MQVSPQKTSCETYIPEQDSTHMKKVIVMTKSQPDSICGIARRIGYTEANRTSIAIYRLKVLNAGKLITLPLPFIVENGIFVEYEQWNQDQKAE